MFSDRGSRVLGVQLFYKTQTDRSEIDLLLLSSLLFMSVMATLDFEVRVGQGPLISGSESLCLLQMDIEAEYLHCCAQQVSLELSEPMSGLGTIRINALNTDGCAHGAENQTHHMKLF